MKKVFLSGIAGTGMSALAGLFQESGWEVLGSDVQFYPPMGDILKNMGVRLFQGYAADNIPADTDLCVIGNVVSRGNPEAERILNENLEYCSMAEALGRFFIKGKNSIVVAGTHGKTTIASFIAHLLETAGLKPGFFIGGKPMNFPANSRLAQSGYFVSEGDEYETSFFDRSAKFLKYFPRILVLTALEYDHLDVYPSEGLYLKSFQNLVNLVPSWGSILVNGDFPLNHQAVGKSFAKVRYYGQDSDDCRIGPIEPLDSGYSFTLHFSDETREYRTRLPGRYNVWNLTAGILLGKQLGIAPELIDLALATFQGVERRLQILGMLDKTQFLEDFAHHPTAIASVLRSLRETYPGKRLVALFEPRSWSLRRNFFQDKLAESFTPADTIVLLDVYEKDRIPENERLNLEIIQLHLEKKGKRVVRTPDYASLRIWLQNLPTSEEQVVVLLSNGSFGGIPDFIRHFCPVCNIIHKI